LPEPIPRQSTSVTSSVCPLAARVLQRMAGHRSSTQCCTAACPYAPASSDASACSTSLYSRPQRGWSSWWTSRGGQRPGWCPRFGKLFRGRHGA
jgi:hypothetical protein